ncbi:MAG: VOC family protein, partial [Pseudomonadota bacterium]|nr:VOC family protein [Pseudomonadota bacterium]
FAHLPPHWFSYIEVDDVNARVAKAETAGAKILRPPFEVPDVGRIGILVDPTGAAVGWMTSAPPS